MGFQFRGLWRHADFTKFWAGQTVSIFGTMLTQIALPLTALLSLNSSPLEQGFLQAAQAAPVLVAGLFAGVWVDRLRRRPVMIASDLARAALLVSIPAAAFGGALTMVLSLRGVTFDWRREEFPALNFAAGRSVGFVAQEVEEVVPEAVTRDAEGFRSVAYSHLTPVLVEAVKEQQAQIENQQKLIETQQQQIEALKKLVCATNRDAGICKQ